MQRIKISNQLLEWRVEPMIAYPGDKEREVIVGYTVVSGKGANQIRALGGTFIASRYRQTIDQCKTWATAAAAELNAAHGHRVNL